MAISGVALATDGVDDPATDFSGSILLLALASAVKLTVAGVGAPVGVGVGVGVVESPLFSSVVAEGGGVGGTHSTGVL